ncbi:MAG: hypothetical protein ACI33P_01215 [Lysinibacillus sp.]
MTDIYDKKHPELKGGEGYTSPASSLPLHELKMLQETIHGMNLQNLGQKIPHSKQQMVLLKFFKSKKNQLVEVYSRNGEEVLHTVGKVNVIGRNFVMLKTLFTRIWIPYTAIHSAKSPFGLPDVPGTHQHVIIDQELRRKLLTNFGETVAGKEVLRQQFYEEYLETNLKSWHGTFLTVYAGKLVKGKVLDVKKGVITVGKKEKTTVPLTKITYIKQTRYISFFQKIMSKWHRHKSDT